jgi:hypothetical protein
VKTEENPYVAPQSPGLARAEPREGALWYVSEGVLHVRDGASLPDVCLSGASPSEPGERKALVIDWCPFWARCVPAVAYLAVLIWLVGQFGPWTTTREDYPVFIVPLVAIGLPAVLVRGVSKRGRLHVFQSHQAKRHESRRWWIEGPPVAIVILGGCLLLDRMFPGFIWKGGLVFLIGLPTSIMSALEQRYKVRASEFESGWFTLVNVGPAAIARFEEIARRHSKPGI